MVLSNIYSASRSVSRRFLSTNVSRLTAPSHSNGNFIAGVSKTKASVYNARNSLARISPTYVRSYTSFVGDEKGSSSDQTSFVSGSNQPESNVGGHGADKAPDGSEVSCCADHAPGQHGMPKQSSNAFPDDSSVTGTNDLDEVLDDEDPLLQTQQEMYRNSDVEFLLENNRRWVERKKKLDPNFFKRQVLSHTPQYLFIGCSDARLSVQNMLGLEDGQLFVHRNVGNQVVNTDLNFITVLTYAVDYLKVKDIIICGHYDCGGVKAAAKNFDHGLIEQWIMGIRDVARYHRKELQNIDDVEAKHRRLVELNVQEQAIKLYANPVVQRSQAEHGKPTIHAFVYDVGEGLLKELEVDFRQILLKYRDVYSMYNFKKKPFVPGAQILKPNGQPATSS